MHIVSVIFGQIIYNAFYQSCRAIHTEMHIHAHTHTHTHTYTHTHTHTYINIMPQVHEGFFSFSASTELSMNIKTQL